MGQKRDALVPRHESTHDATRGARSGAATGGALQSALMHKKLQNRRARAEAAGAEGSAKPTHELYEGSGMTVEEVTADDIRGQRKTLTDWVNVSYNEADKGLAEFQR